MARIGGICNHLGFPYFKAHKAPNHIHFFLAYAVNKGQSVITTNFDSLIEIAAKELDIEMQCIFDNDSLSSCDISQGKHILKLHGTILDEQGKEHRHSISATLKRVGKKGEAFNFDPNIKRCLRQQIKESQLVIIGYSGSDDFDVIPALAQLESIERVIWIWHSNDKSAHGIYSYIDFCKINPEANLTINKLMVYGKRNESDIFIIVGVTSEIIRNIQVLLFNTSIPYIESSEFQPPSYFFYDWKIKYTLEEWRNDYFIANVFFSLGYYNMAENFYNFALNKVNELSEFRHLHTLHHKLSAVCIHQDKYEKALWHLDEMEKICSSFSKPLCDFLKDSGLLNRAISLVHNGKVDLAENILDNIDERDSLDKAKTLYERARIKSIKKDFYKALEFAKKAYQINLYNGNLDSAICNIKFIAQVNNKCGFTRDALVNINDALRLCDITKNQADIADCLKTRGFIFANIKLYQKALYDLNNAYDLYSMEKDKKEIGLAKKTIWDSVAKIRIKYAVEDRNKILLISTYVEGCCTTHSTADIYPDVPFSIDDEQIKKNMGIKGNTFFLNSENQHYKLAEMSKINVDSGAALSMQHFFEEIAKLSFNESEVDSPLVLKDILPTTLP